MCIVPVALMDLSACLRDISNNSLQICTDWAEQCRVKVREQPGIVRDLLQHRQKQGCETFSITSPDEMFGLKKCQKTFFGLEK